MSSYYDEGPYWYGSSHDRYTDDEYAEADAIEAKEKAEEHAQYLGEVPWSDRVDD